MLIERPEISIILLTYNRPEGLKKAVESIYAQTFKKFELIILDNGNTLDYPNIIMDYLNSKHNLRYIKFDENEECLGKRLNQGLSVSNGKYISFLMDDDVWYPTSLKNLYAGIVKGLDFVYGQVQSIDSVTGKITPNSYATIDWKKGIIKKANSIHITSVLIKKNLFNKIGGFHEGMRRSYDLDMWNRIFDKSKCLRLNKIISQISVNNMSSITGKLRSDISQTVAPWNYPLIGYWAKRKSVSFLGDERKFIQQINDRHLPWVATHDDLKADASVSWALTTELKTYQGDNYYYIDHPSIVQDEMLDLCDGVITQFPYETLKPHCFLRPSVSLAEILATDKIFYVYQKNLRILCPKITEDNVDFIYILMDYVADRYSGIFFYFFPNSEIRKLLDSIPNLIPTELQEDSYQHFKQHGVDVVLHVNGDSNSYVDAYKAFLISSVIRAPLVTSPNIAFDSILENGVDIYTVDQLQSFVQSIDKAKDIEIREKMILNMRKKTYLYFLDQVILDKFIIFLNENHKETDCNLSIAQLSADLSYETSVEQLDANSKVLLHSGENITQTFIPKLSSFDGIQFFGNCLNNYAGNIGFLLKRGNDIIFQKIIPNHNLKNGLNTVSFDKVTEFSGQAFSFTFYADTPSFELEYNNSIMSAGLYYSNGIPKKACLKFRVIRKT